MQSPYIIIFDSQCSFCNASVNFVFNHDPKGLFLFASMHSSIAQSLITQKGIGDFDSDTIILIKGERYYFRAEAVYEILKELKGICSVLGIFRSLGKGINDSFYRYIAKNRHRLFAKRPCIIPSEELRSRFLTDTL